jgi:formate--tetrahydrofolate ligase
MGGGVEERSDDTTSLPVPTRCPGREDETIATRIYGADGVDFGAGVPKTLERIESDGRRGLPICMARRTSLDRRTSRPSVCFAPVRDARLFAAPASDRSRRHAHDARPAITTAGEGVDIDAEGNVVGLF